MSSSKKQLATSFDRLCQTRQALVAARVKRLREDRSLTQVAAAEIAGIPRPTWAYLETPKANPRLTTLLRVAVAFKVTLADLLEGA